MAKNTGRGTRAAHDTELARRLEPLCRCGCGMKEASSTPIFERGISLRRWAAFIAVGVIVAYAAASYVVWLVLRASS